jgi:hypothetical protein
MDTIVFFVFFGVCVVNMSRQENSIVENNKLEGSQTTLFKNFEFR